MLTYAAAERNKDAILDVLKRVLTTDCAMDALEIGSGSGQHITHFASHFTRITWQPSDVETSLFASINAHSKHYGLDNVKPAIALDASLPPNEWPQKQYDVILCSNVIHISPWKCTVGLFRGCGALLKSKTGLLITYGPYAIDGVLTPQSNVNFDTSLRSQNPEWGVRDLRQLKQLASDNHLSFINMYDMPANNKTLIFKKL